MLAPLNINPFYLHLSLLFFKMLSHGLALESQSNHMTVSKKSYSHFTDAEVEAELISNDLPKVNWWQRKETTRARMRLPTVYLFPWCCPGFLKPVSSKTGYATRSPRSREEGTPLSRPHLLPGRHPSSEFQGPKASDFRGTNPLQRQKQSLSHASPHPTAVSPCHLCRL